MSLIENERTKLTATAINNLALAIVVAGVVAPVAALSFNLTTAPAASVLTVGISLIWLILAGALHLVARWLLRKLEP